MFKIKKASPAPDSRAYHQPQPLESPAPYPPGRKLLTIALLLLAAIALVHLIAVTHTAYPTPSKATCQDLIRNSDYTKFVQLQPGRQEMGAVQLVDQLLAGQPAALVPVMDNSPQHLLDIYVYGCFMQQQKPSLTLLFKQQGLIQGTLNVSDNNLLSISELDTTITAEGSIQLEPLQQNIYREYLWRDHAFIQTTFPGLYPVTSHSEADALQDQENNGQTLPWNDPLVTSEQMAKDLFHWSGEHLHSSLQDNNGTIAHVQLTSQNPHMEVTVTLMRLIQPNETGLWFVTRAQTPGLTLDQASISIPSASPISLKGTGALNNGTTTAVLFDHTLAPLHLLHSGKMHTTNKGIYSGTLPYTSTIANQPGLLLLESIPAANSSEMGQLLLTGLILG